MLPDDAKIISVDDHVIEHPRVWLDRLPAKYADVAPRIVKLPDGNDTWLLATVDLLMSEVFYKFPNLRVALSEGGIGWMPYLLERTDYSWGRHKYWCNINADKVPSELFREHIYGCFIADQAGIEQRHRIGIDNIMFESDYPHSDSNWPHTRKLLAEHLVDVPDDEARKIVELNARTLYHFWA